MAQNEMCSICEQQPEDLLILSCQHNLCVNCATQVYALNSQSNIFSCEICLCQTELDAETIAYLCSMTKRQFVEEPKMEVSERPPKSGKNTKRDQSNICEAHKQISMYFCFDCETSKICSECILTPKHAKHKVYTLKKAMGIMQKKVADQIRSKQMLKEQLYGEKNKYIETKQYTKSCMSQYKQELKEVFDEIVRGVSDKYGQICSQLEEEIKKKEEIVDGCLHQITNKIQILEQTVSFQKKILKEKQQKDFISYYQQIHHDNELFLPKLPTDIPEINLTLANHESAIYQVRKVLNKIAWIKNQEYVINHHEQSLPASIIERQYNQLQDHPKTILRESHQRYNNSHSKSSYMPKSSSRKLQLSRSIDNATNIINKLQERSRNA